MTDTCRPTCFALTRLPAGSALARAAGVVCVGAPLVLCFTAGVAVLIRRCTKTQVLLLLLLLLQQLILCCIPAAARIPRPLFLACSCLTVSRSLTGGLRCCVQMEHWPYHAAMLEVTWRHWAGWGG